MRDERPERVADVLADDKIGNFIEFSRLAVDDDKSRTTSFCVQRKSRRGPDDKRGADRNEKITTGAQRLGTAHLLLRHRLAEGYSRCLDIAAAVAIGRVSLRRIEFLFHPKEFVALLAIEAGRISGIAVQFDDVSR